MDINQFYNNLRSQALVAKTRKALKVIKNLGERYIIDLPKETAHNIVRKAKLEQKKLLLVIKRKSKTIKE